MNLPTYTPPPKPPTEKIKLVAVKTRARKKGPPLRPGRIEDDKRFVRYF